MLLNKLMLDRNSSLVLERNKVQKIDNHFDKNQIFVPLMIESVFVNVVYRQNY